MKTSRTLGLLAASVLLLAGGTSGAVRSSWSPPSILSRAGAGAPMVAVDAAGNTIAVWGTEQGVQVSIRPAGGRFGAPQDLLQSGLWGYGYPDVAVDAAGNAAVVWAAGAPPATHVQAALRRPGGAFGPPEEIAVSRNASGTRIALDERGGGVAVWFDLAAEPEAGSTVRAAIRSPDGGWQAPQVLGTASYPFPVLAVDPAGDAVVVWADTRPDRSVIESAYRPAGGVFGPSTTVSNAGRAPDVAFDPKGNAVAVWSNAETIQTATRQAATGLWGPAADIARGSSPKIGVDGRGDAIVAWGSRSAGGEGVTQTIQASIRPAGGAWQPPVTLSAPGDFTHMDPVLAVNARGDAVVAWGMSIQIVAAAVRTAGAPFGPARDVSQAGVVSWAPSVAIDPRGNATLTWQIRRSPLTRYSRLGYAAAASYEAAATQRPRRSFGVSALQHFPGTLKR